MTPTQIALVQKSWRQVIALIWTLGQGLGEAFTDEVEQAWVATYAVLAKTMQDAAGSGP